MGAADWVLAGGTDELDLKLFAGFHALGLLSDLPCVPFGQTVGTNLGEGAAFFVFEREEDARSRSHEPIAILEGFGTSCDGYHATSPHPSGDGLVRAARAALREAGVVPSDIDWVSAHGTGTRANDAAESWVITRLFEERAHTVPVSASKSLVGHTLGAAGTVELAIAILALQNGCIPPTAGVEQRRAECSVDVVIEKRAAPSKRVLKLGAAFGGANAALVIALPDAAPAQARVRPRRTVRIVGAGAMGGAVAAIDPMGDASDLRGPIGRFAFEDLVRGVDPRGLDATSRYLIVAAQRALERAGIALGGATSDRTGLFVGQRRASPASHVEFEASIASRGLAGVSRSAFTRKVLNTATGAASRGLSLRGPTTTLSTGRGGGLVAVALAAEHLATRDEADVLLAGAVEELGPPDDEAVTGEGAAVIALAAAPACIRTDDVVLAGWAIGGPHQGASVARQALERAGLDPATVVEIFSPGRVTGVPAFAGVLELGRALASIRSGTVPRALVVEAGSLATTAFVLVAASPGDHDAC
jgi:3-oxoacyl-[acyl-carrier-protein] synthase II